MGSIPGSGRSPGEGNGNPLQYSCLENYKDRGVWWATVHGVTKSWMWLSTHTTTWRKKRVEVGARFLNICLFVSFWFLDFVKKKKSSEKKNINFEKLLEGINTWPCDFFFFSVSVFLPCKSLKPWLLLELTSWITCYWWW